MAEKPEGKRTPGRSRSRLEDNIKMSERRGCGGGGVVVWIQVAQDSVQW
jgi:hypothetical protein